MYELTTYSYENRENETSRRGKEDGDGFDRPNDRPSDHRPCLVCVSESICEYSRSAGLSGRLNECWKGGKGMDTAACRPTLGERDIILNGMVLTAAVVPCTDCLAMPMNSVDSERGRVNGDAMI